MVQHHETATEHCDQELLPTQGLVHRHNYLSVGGWVWVLGSLLISREREREREREILMR